MYENLLHDRNIIPNDDLIKEKLGDLFQIVEEIRKHIIENHGEITLEWKYYGKKLGWTLKTLLKKRNLFFITVSDKRFRIAFVFGDKAVSKIEKSNISQELISELLEALKYSEGRGLRLIMEDDRYLKDILKLIDIKLEK